MNEKIILTTTDEQLIKVYSKAPNGVDTKALAEWLVLNRNLELTLKGMASIISTKCNISAWYAMSYVKYQVEKHPEVKTFESIFELRYYKNNKKDLKGVLK